jgi:hypothetical protein
MMDQLKVAYRNAPVDNMATELYLAELEKNGGNEKLALEMCAALCKVATQTFAKWVTGQKPQKRNHNRLCDLAWTKGSDTAFAGLAQ